MSIYFCPRINTKIYIEGLEEKIKNIEMKWFERLGNSLNKKLPLQLIVTQGKRINSDRFLQISSTFCVIKREAKLPRLLKFPAWLSLGMAYACCQGVC